MRHARWAATVLLGMSTLCGGQDLPPRASRPAEPRAELLRLVGEYGAPGESFTVYESGRHLFADGQGLRRAALRPSAGRFVTDGSGMGKKPSVLEFEGSRTRPAVAVFLDGIRLDRRDQGAEVLRVIRAGLHVDVAALHAAALRAVPPVEAAPLRAADLVNLAGIETALKFEIRYATTNNFMGFPLYARPGAYLQRPAAEALVRVARSLALLGYDLLVHDAYRPWFVTKMFWDATPEAAHVFVADPAAGSRHNRGCAVDVTLYDRSSHTAVQMTSRYDEMSPRSYADYVGGTSRERWLRDLLREAMERQGFTVYPQEWWHFDYVDWHDYGIGNVPFERLEAATRAGQTIPAHVAPAHSG